MYNRTELIDELLIHMSHELLSLPEYASAPPSKQIHTIDNIATFLDGLPDETLFKYLREYSEEDVNKFRCQEIPYVKSHVSPLLPKK